MSVELLRDLLARIVWVREELCPFAREIALEALEEDLIKAIEEGTT